MVLVAAVVGPAVDLVLPRDCQRQLSVVDGAVTIQVVLLEQVLEGALRIVHASLLQDPDELVAVDGATQVLVEVLEHLDEGLVLSLLCVTALAQLLLDVVLKSVRMKEFE